MRQQSIYKADLAGVALKIQESRVIALWLLEQAAGKTEKSWDELIYRDNEVQIRGRSTLRRQANLMRARLQGAPEAVLRLVAEGEYRTASQACLAAAIMHSRLLGDFMDILMRNELAKHNRELTAWHWDAFLDDCKARDPLMSEWSKTTRDRIKTTVFSILKDAGFLVREGGWIIQTPKIETELEKALQDADERYALRCMRLTI